MHLILFLLAAFFATNALAGCMRKRCPFGSGYGCIPIRQCPAKCLTCYTGCKFPSVCCNLRKLNACSFAGGFCNRTCKLENRHAWCPRPFKCCVYVAH
uniref:Carboxypeptidase inhibitor n=1 Tax=Rhipicephalus zambeziensis TaxID=60191 RepID=A0A224Y2P6_9ACAR